MRRKAINALSEFLEIERLRGCSEQTISRKLREIRDFLRFIRGRYEKVTSVEAERYINCLKETRKPKYVNSVITSLKQFFNYLIAGGDVLINPFVKIEKVKSDNETDAGIFSESEIKSILKSTEKGRRKIEAIKKRDRAIIELLY